MLIQANGPVQIMCINLGSDHTCSRYSRHSRHSRSGGAKLLQKNDPL
jgi:hypothetical protein